MSTVRPVDGQVSCLLVFQVWMRENERFHSKRGLTEIWTGRCHATRLIAQLDAKTA